MNETSTIEVEALEGQITPPGVFMLAHAIYGGDDLIENLCKALETALSTLGERDRRILELRYGLRDGIPRTLAAIGAELHLTKSRVQQLEARALKRLRGSSNMTVAGVALLASGRPAPPQNLDDRARTIRIEEMMLPPRVYNALRRGRVKYACELLDERRTYSIKGIGDAALAVIDRELVRLGIKA
ncbi:MAG: sigma factor-like helix-turn-helix DNA-binding protein [Dehalococcoidales bacterium]|nr:sigma factor-like helix-turn-helix DNA-binding protein [Dehalococcoidales bacterium]